MAAKPVGSEFLVEKHNFGICPATIRNEMQILTREEYIFQPHTSSGRVPTDKGYRFFVNNLLEKSVSELFDLKKVEEIFEKEKEDIFKLSKKLTRFLAESCSGFAISFLSEEDFIFKEGWEQVFREPEFRDKELILNFVEFLEEFEKEIKNININSKPRVYIGQESPFKKAQDFSIILAMYHLPGQKEKRGEGKISIVGPKRMPYEKNINLMNSLIKIIEEY